MIKETYEFMGMSCSPQLYFYLLSSLIAGNLIVLYLFIGAIRKYIKQPKQQ